MMPRGLRQYRANAAPVLCASIFPPIPPHTHWRTQSPRSSVVLPEEKRGGQRRHRSLGKLGDARAS
jgi:hypothetical protein